MKKRRFVSMLLAFMCVLSLFAANKAYACTYPATTYAAADEAVVYAEQTKWCFRVKDGILEKRLWSLTYGRWLTEWTPINEGL